MIPGLPALTQTVLGLAADRPLPRFRGDAFHDWEVRAPDGRAHEVILLPDAFNRYFEPENLRAAIRVLRAAGYDPAVARPPRGMRPLDEGRTLLAAGMVDEARAEARRVIAALAPFASPVVGIEPSSLTTLRDEFLVLLSGEESRALAARALLLSELLERDKPALAFKPLQATVHIHGHCHQKAFGAFPAAVALLKRIPGVTVKPITSSCCGMAGAFGYQAESLEASKAMAELSLLISSSPMALPVGIRLVIWAAERRSIPCGFWTAPWHERRGSHSRFLVCRRPRHLSPDLVPKE
jgi:Fe-S oxidoreductase